MFFHTGTPSAPGSCSSGWSRPAPRAGCATSPTRGPGTAHSDRRPGRTVADCAPDVAAIADELGIGRFYTVGWSGGGPHALACAALLGDRVMAAATLAGVAPRDAEGLDWLAGWATRTSQEFAAAELGSWS